MAVVLAPMGAAFGSIGTFNPAMLVHGEEGITLHREIPAEGELEAVSEITAIYDKGKGADGVSDTNAKLADSGEHLFDQSEERRVGTGCVRRWVYLSGHEPVKKTST